MSVSRLLLLISFFGSVNVWAKTAQVEWTPIAGANGYELEVVKEGDTPQIHKMAKTEWAGELKPGLYRYRVRGIDRFKRPGQWSAPQPLVLMPPQAVELESPAKGAEVQYFGKSPEVALKWKPVEGVSRYRVQIWKDGKRVTDQKSAGLEWRLKGQADGAYRWKVSGWLEMGTRHWETESSAEWEFAQKKQALLAPEVRFPRGMVPTPKDGKLRVRWNAVEGATVYELKVWKATDANVPKGRALASATDLGVKTYRSMQPQLVVPVKGDGAYRLQLRAIAAVTPPVAGGTLPADAVEGPTTAEDFSLSQHALYSEGSGYVALSTIAAPYTYTYVSPLNGGTARAGALSLVGRLSGEYWFNHLWGMGGAGELSYFRMNSRGYFGKVFELNGKMRINFGKDRWGWIIQPKLGIEMRDYFAVTPQDAASTENITGIFGASVGFDVRKQLFERFSLSLKLNYFIPLVPVYSSSPTTLTLTPDASYRNVSVGLQAAYWIGGHFGVAAGAIGEFRSISVKLPISPNGAAEQIYMDGLFFFGSVIYSFGR